MQSIATAQLHSVKIKTGMSFDLSVDDDDSVSFSDGERSSGLRRSLRWSGVVDQNADSCFGGGGGYLIRVIWIKVPKICNPL